MKIPNDLKAKLRRMSELDAVCKRDVDDTEDYILEEYRALLAEVVLSVENFVSLLCKAGLLHVNLELTTEVVLDIASAKYRDLSFDVASSFVNGGIYLNLIPEVTGGMALVQPKDEDRRTPLRDLLYQLRDCLGDAAE